MAKRLKDYFPLIRSREEVFEEIYANESLYTMYRNWEEEAQKEFLEFCSGARGVKVTYDGFFKEIMNPEYEPERLESLLSILLGEEVKILQVLPNDTVRIADELTLLITDISTDEPERIAELIEKFPDFKIMYDEVYEICRNVEEVMGMYSRELREMDKNTISYMVEELQDEVDKVKKESQEALDKERKENQEALDKERREKQEAFNRIRELEERLRALENGAG